MMTKSLVLFLCTGNSARSQMAEALLRKYAGNHFDVQSAGLEPKGIHPFTLKVMEEMCIDLSRHRSKSLSEFIGQVNPRYVITLCGPADASCPRSLWSKGEKLHWPFEDPAAFNGNPDEMLAKFRDIRDQIDLKVQSWLTELV